MTPPSSPEGTEYTDASPSVHGPESRNGMLSDSDRLSAIIAAQNAIATSELDLASLMQLIVERTQELTRAGGAAFELREGEEMVYRAASGLTAPFLGLRLHIQTSLSGSSVLTGDILRCDDAETDPRVDQEACRKIGVRSFIVVPLRYRHQLQGVLKVLSPFPGHFQDVDVQSLELMAGLFGAVVNHAATLEDQKLTLAGTQGALEQQMRLFDTALTSIADYVFICDLEGRITYANRARLHLWQRKLEDVLGKNFLELGYPEALAARVHGQIQNVIATRQPLRAEAEYTSASGLAGYYDYILVPVIGGDGAVECVTGSTRNITERKQMETALQASEEQSREILESITDAFFALDREWRFTYVNRQAERILGRSPGDLLGKVIWEVYTGMAGSEFEPAYLRAADEGIASSVTAFYPDHDRWYEVHTYPAHHGITIYFRNVTEKIRTEEEREKHVRHIEALNGRLRRAMQETHHRVKNNLQVISAMIEMQILEHKDADAIPLEEFSRLQAHVHTLSIVHDLLTRNVKEEEDAQRISTKAVLEKLLPILQRTAWKQTVHYAMDEVVLTSKQCIALSLVLNELVSNALKHGRNQAEVFFTAEGQEATLAVCDDGDGFRDGFDPMQAANTGLELVESLVRTDLAGTVAYGNQAQGGGQVTVTFPLPQDGALDKEALLSTAPDGPTR